MNRHDPERTGGDVVVGIDGSANSFHALSWAAREASSAGAGLHLVTAYRTPSPDGPATELVLYDTDLSSAEAVLGQAKDWCTEQYPGLAVSDAPWLGASAAALLSEARDARMLVVGGSSRAPAATRTGSVPRALAARASCPVAVVRGRNPDSYPRWDGDTVLGLEGSGHDEALLAAAFDAAARRCGRLTIVRARGGADGTAVVRPDARLARWSEKFPEVQVTSLLVHDLPIRALLTLSEQAGLLVLGARGDSSIPGVLLGSVAGALVDQAHCPVLVVRGV